MKQYVLDWLAAHEIADGELVYTLIALGFIVLTSLVLHFWPG